MQCSYENKFDYNPEAVESFKKYKIKQRWKKNISRTQDTSQNQDEQLSVMCGFISKLSSDQ